jgi:GTPase
MFLDTVTIDVASGEGGNGCVAWRKEKFVAFGGPAGGDGGNGGSVYIQSDPQIQTLVDFRYQRKYVANNGESGMYKNMHGKAAKDLTIYVPCGTLIKDVSLNAAIADLTEPGSRILVAKGGRGGRGNARFATARNKAPYYAEPGEGAVTRQLVLELKLIADVGLLGMPNAGKSTFISTVSAARPKIADYPFTTLTPNLGVVRKPNGDGVVLADIPGLIEGASQGIGLGHDFLRHVERTRLLLHLVDATACDGGTPLGNYQLIQAELARYSPWLAQKPQLLVLTKADGLLDEERDELVAQFQTELGADTPVFVISSVARQGVDELLHAMLTRLDTLPQQTGPLVPVIADPKAMENDDSEFEVEQYEPGEYHVYGKRLMRWLMITDTTQAASLRHLFNIMKVMGVMEALKKAGIEPGDTVYLGKQGFEYSPAGGIMTSRRSRRRGGPQGLPTLDQDGNLASEGLSAESILAMDWDEHEDDLSDEELALLMGAEMAEHAAKKHLAD